MKLLHLCTHSSYFIKHFLHNLNHFLIRFFLICIPIQFTTYLRLIIIEIPSKSLNTLFLKSLLNCVKGLSIIFFGSQPEELRFYSLNVQTAFLIINEVLFHFFFEILKCNFLLILILFENIVVLLII